MKLICLLLSFIVCSAALAQDPATKPATVPVSQDPSLPTPNIANKHFFDLHAEFLQRLSAGPIGVLFLGDSITEGWKTKGATIWQQFYGNLQPVNFGISGDKTQHVLWRIANGEFDDCHPQVTVLMIGTNNVAADPADKISAAITSIVKSVRDKTGGKVLLLAVFPRNFGPDAPDTMDKVRKINQSIAQLDDGKAVRYLDIGAKFVGPEGKVPKDIMPDGLHPNARGYQIWAEAMQPLLAEMLKAPSTQEAP